MDKILVTGANGFIGQQLCKALSEKGYAVTGVFRSREKFTGYFDFITGIVVGEIDAETDWTEALKGVDAVVHLASRVHIMHDSASNPLEEYRKVNTAGTRRLAEISVKAGVRRFVFLSTVKVNGEYTTDRPFTEDNVPNPLDPYAISKWEAELALRDIVDKTGLKIVILRPPLVYGPNVKANFLRLLGMVNKGIPLALVNNARSMVYIGNLVDAIIQCIEYPDALNQTFLVSDGHDISTPDLIRMIAKAMDKKPRLIPCPTQALKFLGRLTKKSIEIERLIGSLQIDNSKIKNVLNWHPPFTMEEGIKETVKWYSR